MAYNIFSGLESLGFGGLENLDLFGKEEKKEKEAVKAEAVVVSEKDFLFDKTTECPCCETQFKIRAVKNSAARLVGTDKDLRPRHENIDITKYDCIMCPMCGYSALSRYFPNVLKSQRELIKTNISANFQVRPGYPEILSYDDAIEIYKMALLNAVVKKAKDSEKAYICLKTSWLYRGKAEEVGESNPEYNKIKECEREFTRNAYEGFSSAMQAESFPMCGMDETTFDYLLANLAFMTGHNEVCSKLIAKLLTSRVASSRIKDKTRDLKEDLLNKLRSEANNQ